jgi:hypothetical protein
MSKIQFRAFGEMLHVINTGPVYVSPCNGQQHVYLSDAVRREVESLVRDGGDDPADCEDEIDAIVEKACR